MITDRGMDMSDLDTVGAKELAVFEQAYRDTHGRALDAYGFWLEFAPAVVKRHRAQALASAGAEGKERPLHGTVGFLHLYAVMGYSEGVRYEVHHARNLGASREHVLQVLEIAFAHSGPRGMHAATGASDLFREWQPDVSAVGAYPDGWGPDTDAFEIPWGHPLEPLTNDEFEALCRWYEKTCGRVPSTLVLLRRWRPLLVKAYHDRLARALKGSLPKQMLPFVLVQMNVAQGNAEAIVDSVRWALSWGLTPDQCMEAVSWGMLYGGPEALAGCSAPLVELLGEPSPD